MKNTKAKGKRIEKDARLILESEGWLVEQANPKLCFIGPGRMISKAHDFFGCWDFIAVRNYEIKWVQISTWAHKSDKIKQVERFPFGNEQEIWLWFSQGKGSHFKILKREYNWEWNGHVKFKIKKCKEAREINVPIYDCSGRQKTMNTNVEVKNA